MGCIKNLEIARSTFDLLRNSYGVRKGCILEVGSILLMLECVSIKVPLTYPCSKVTKSKPVEGWKRDEGETGSNPHHGPCSILVDLMVFLPLFCDQPIRSVSFLKGGYVELSPKPLLPESELLATFATKNSSGIILVALGREGEKQGHLPAHGVSSSNVIAIQPGAQEGIDFEKH